MRKKSLLSLLLSGFILFTSVYPTSASQSATKKREVKTNPSLKISTQNANTSNTTLLKSVSSIEKLDNDQIGQTSDDDNIIFDPSGNGVYFLKNTSDPDIWFYKEYNLIYYDLRNHTYKNVYSPSKAEHYFMNDHAAYFSAEKINIEKDEDSSKFWCSLKITKYDFDTKSSSSITLDDISLNAYQMDYITSFGVDHSGRIYIATCDNTLLLFDKQGKFLSQTSCAKPIYEFCGFDPVNNNFYYTSIYDWLYWGYHHDMSSLMAGNVSSNNSISLKDKNIMILYQRGFFDHKTCVKMLNDKYLAALSTFNGDNGILLDSNKYDYTDVTDQATSINPINNSVSVSIFNIANTKAITTAYQTAESEYESDVDISSIGPRCALNSDNTSLIVKTDSDILTEYDLKSKKGKIRLQTKHPIYTFSMIDDQCIVIEKDDDDFYIEKFDWNYPDDFQMNAPSSLTVGSSAQINCSVEDSDFKLDFDYKSSDPSVVSVDENGKLNAFKPGKVSITIKASPINISKTLDIVVTDSALSKSNEIYKIISTKGASSTTMHQTNLEYYYQTPQTAYLTPLENGNYERIEYIGGKIICETYDSSFKLLNTRKLSSELSLWGGYFSGSKYNYLLFGQPNLSESDKKEVIRIVKYDKNWKRLDSCSIKGANTYIPFDAGNADMTETNGKLYLHTCHEMYKTEDDYHHQANCTFVINENDMSVYDSYYDIMNLSYGYVSHSFSQKIATDGNNIYRSDLGDANPRGIAFSVTNINNKIYEPHIYESIIDIPGNYGANYTGFTLDSLKLSEDYYMVCGSGITKNNPTPNVYINCGIKNSPTSGATWITSYKSSNHIEILQTKLVSLNTTQFLLMWEEKNTSKNTYETKMVLLNENGKVVSDIYTSKLALSLCNPIVNKDGMVVWYVTNNSGPSFIKINPYQLSKVASATKPSVIGRTITISGRKYKITTSNKVTFLGMTKKSATTLTIPDYVKYSGKKYNVTAIAKNACQKQSKLKKVIIGKNVTTIGNKSFYNCKNLKNITIKTSNLTLSKVGSSAFKGTYKKATFKVPAKKKNSYKKILLKRGASSKAKFTK